MAAKEYDAWLDKLARESGYKSAVILHGNIGDIVRDKYGDGRYVPVVEAVVQALKHKGFENIVRWDRVSGMKVLSGTRPCAASGNINGELAGELGLNLNSADNDGPEYADPSDFLGYVHENMGSKTQRRTAYILDYSDLIFGNTNAFTDSDRQNLATLLKALEQAQPYNKSDPDFKTGGDAAVIVARDIGALPPSFYLNNPAVGVVNVPSPGRNERELYLQENVSDLRVSQNLRDQAAMADLTDALDGFTIKEIAQLSKLSRQREGDAIPFEKLINLYKFGEEHSAWEDLDKAKLKTTGQKLKERVKGQDGAIKKISDVLVRAYTGFSGLQHSAKQKKPKGTLFFVGPTGVGKTELAKALAAFVFGDEDACIRFDMSEYNHEHSDQKLIGAPPGYVGYEEGGQLTNAVMKRPFCVLLFDEIEKAHPRILDKFLQILEDGRLTDSKGQTAYFSESIIIFTSNIGAANVNSEDDEGKVREYFLKAVGDHFNKKLERPELLNRIGDNIVPFNFIDSPDVFTQILRLKFDAVKAFVKEKYRADLVFEDEDAVYDTLALNADKKHGGRGILNLMEKYVMDPLAEFVFDNMEMLTGRQIKLSHVDKNIPNMPLFIFELV